MLTRFSYRLDMAALMGADVRCNMNCPWCHQDYFPVSNMRSGACTLSYPEAVSLVETAIGHHEFTELSFHLSGRAEPLMLGVERLAIEIRALAAAQPRFKRVMTTNGLLLDSTMAHALVNAGLQRINLSVNLDRKEPRTESALTACDEAGLAVSFNTLIREPDSAQIKALIERAVDHHASIKMFALLSLATDCTALIGRTASVLAAAIGASGEYDSCTHRLKWHVNGATDVCLKLPGTTAPAKAAACRVCEKRNACQEGCWQSIRITPWYVKPCGVREDNVYYYAEHSPTALRLKLRVGGKLDSRSLP